MGLDMYLERVTWCQGKEVMVDGKVVPDVKTVHQDAMYWRKANAIHQWFVDHVQGGKDECQESEVSREQLQELLDTVEKVLASRVVPAHQEVSEDGSEVGSPTLEAEELLPTQAGFFFGGTKYDRHYWEDLLETKEELEKVLTSGDAAVGGSWFTYRASW